MLGRIIETLRQRKGETLSYAHDHNEPMESAAHRPGGPLTDLSVMVQFVERNAANIEKVLRFACHAIDTIEAEGGIAVKSFGVELLKVKL